MDALFGAYRLTLSLNALPALCPLYHRKIRIQRSNCFDASCGYHIGKRHKTPPLFCTPKQQKMLIEARYSSQ